MLEKSFRRATETLLALIRQSHGKVKRTNGRHPGARRLRFEGLEDRRVLADAAEISVGSPGVDGQVRVEVDGYGAFGRAQGGNADGDAWINRIGPGGEAQVMYESDRGKGTFYFS